ncbi:hypothetical protein PRIC1_015083 [Phytophthora ramorum]
MQQDEVDQALDATILLPDEEASLSKQIITNYFTSDGPRARRLGSSDLEPERSILDESSGDEELRHYGKMPAEVLHETEREPSEVYERETVNSGVDNREERAMGMLEEILTWEIALSVVVVILALAHCVWMWNLVELSTLNLEFGD